jgi:arylsulfatase A-like enzyme
MLASLLMGSPLLAAERPANVILVSIDTLRADHLGCSGYRRETSPAIDRFRRDSILFTQAIAQAPSTLVSHASLLTSLWPHEHGASERRHRALPPDALTLAEVLRSHGFATLSYNGGGQIDPVFGLGQGFDTYRTRDEHDFAAAVAPAIAWIDRNPGRRFFLFLHTYEVHHPYTPDATHRRLFEASYAGPLPDAITIEVLQSINDGRMTLGVADLEHVIAAYDAEIRSVDDDFAALLEFLVRRGLYDETLIVFTSDHGEEFGEHGRVGWHSHTLYDELLRVPLIVKLPGSRHAGATVTQQVRSIDVPTTILAVLDLPVPASFRGIDLVPLARGEPVAALPAVAMQDGGDAVVLRTERWKLYGDILHDLEQDPHEVRDAASGNADVAARLRVELGRMLGAPRAGSGAPAARPDARTLERLRSLGYVH